MNYYIFKIGSHLHDILVQCSQASHEKNSVPNKVNELFKVT